MNDNPYKDRRPRDPAPTPEELKFFLPVTEGVIEEGDWVTNIRSWAYGLVGQNISTNGDKILRYMPPPEV